ncbi:MAG: noncanonical pyrimidine nucleotidase, YjjG family [Flavobacteriales bacterium]|nr:noncanonical pyrimidine nucleotidase, YjjG family [Flavobacteriales bacterium]
MDRYRDLFFDLDHTLWDFDTNSRSALQELFNDYLNPLSTDFDRFHQTYVEVNDNYWQQYRAGRVTKKVLRIGRFRDALIRFGFDDEALSWTLADQYVKRSPYQTALFPYAIETLEYLREKGYQMHIITNGFEEVQHIKLEQSGLLPFFSKVITSEMVGQRKPHERIFRRAMQEATTTPDVSIMIGDNLEADIKGAQHFGMDQVFFNPYQKAQDIRPTYVIEELRELREIL